MPFVKPTDVSIPVERARVLFSYTAENEDELSIEPGQVINIRSKSLDDSGWWRGELNGNVGVFPDNFVELLPEEVASVGWIFCRLCAIVITSWQQPVGR